MTDQTKQPVFQNLLKGCRIVDGNGNPPVENGAILIEDGIIKYAGTIDNAPNAKDAKDAKVINLTGLTVMPGLIDGHNCINGNPRCAGLLRGYLQHGVTTVASFHGNWPGEPPAALLRDAVEGGAVRGCARLLAGYVVNCTNGHNDGRAADGPWEVRKAVREMIQAGADFIKTAASGGFWGAKEGAASPNYTAEELTALVEEAHAWGKPVGVHVHSQPGLNRAIECGVDLIYHGCFIDDSAIEKMAKKGNYYVPTLKVTSERNIKAHHHRPWMMEEMFKATKIHREGVRKAKKAGVKIGLGCDGPGSPYTWAPGESTVFELTQLVDCGLSPMEAITAGTSVIAKAYKIDNRVGSIEAGKEADIVCVAGKPDENIKHIQDNARIALVFQKGRIEYAGKHYEHLYCCQDAPYNYYCAGMGYPPYNGIDTPLTEHRYKSDINSADKKTKDNQNNSNTTIRQAKENDINTISNIAKKAWQPLDDALNDNLGEQIFNSAVPVGAERKEEQIKTHFKKYPKQVLVAEAEGEVLGFIQYFIDKQNSIGEIGNNAVAPEARGKGVAKKLCEAALEEFKKQNLKVAKVGTRVDGAHAPARRVYERLGFNKEIHELTYYKTLYREGS